MVLALATESPVASSLSSQTVEQRRSTATVPFPIPDASSTSLTYGCSAPLSVEEELTRVVFPRIASASAGPAPLRVGH